MPSEQYESFLSSLKRNDVESCERIISESPQILAEKDDSGRNILHHAVLEDKPDITLYLTKNHKEIINEADHEGKTPLYIAAEQGKEGHVRTLLIAKADPNVETPNIYTFKRATPILLQVIPNGHSKISRMLVDAGADVRVANREGENPLHLSVIFNDPKLSADILEKNSSIINEKDKEGNTALHLASSFDDKHTFLLLDHGSDPSIKNNYGMNAIHFAASKGSTALAELLTAKPDLINSVDNFGRTPLHISELFDNTKAKTMLLQEGADTFIKDNKGRTAKQYAAIRQNSGEISTKAEGFLDQFSLEERAKADRESPKPSDSSSNSLASTVRSGSPESLGASPRDRAESGESASMASPSPVKNLREALEEAALKSPSGKPPLVPKGTPAKKPNYQSLG